MRKPLRTWNRSRSHWPKRRRKKETCPLRKISSGNANRQHRGRNFVYGGEAGLVVGPIRMLELISCHNKRPKICDLKFCSDFFCLSHLFSDCGSWPTLGTVRWRELKMKILFVSLCFVPWILSYPPHLCKLPWPRMLASPCELATMTMEKSEWKTKRNAITKGW